MSEAELLDIIRSRRSVRRFQSWEVPPALLDEILVAALSAPSAHNRQPWRFAVVHSKSHKARLAELMGLEFRRDLQGDGLAPAEIDVRLERSRERILQAAALIILCLDPTDLDHYPDQFRNQAEHLMAVQSVAMAGSTLMLAAHACGLGSVWICAPLFAPQAVLRALDLPATWQPQGMLLTGYPAHLPPSRPRRPLAEVTRYY